MTTLYLHGLNSSNISLRTDWLQQFGTVINPLLSYKNIPETYQKIEKLIHTFHPDVIVGSSMGGYLGFHLGNYYRIPTLLLNPALIMSILVRPDNRFLASDTKHTISLGKNDPVIRPEITKRLLQDWQQRYQIFEYEIEHQTPFEVFLDVATKSGLFVERKGISDKG